MSANPLKNASISTIEDLREAYPNGLVQDLWDYIKVSDGGKDMCYLKDGDRVKPFTVNGESISENITDLDTYNMTCDFLEWPKKILYTQGGELATYKDLILVEWYSSSRTQVEFYKYDGKSLKSTKSIARFIDEKVVPLKIGGKEVLENIYYLSTGWGRDIISYKWSHLSFDPETNNIFEYEGSLCLLVGDDKIEFYKDTWGKKLSFWWHWLFVDGKIIPFKLFGKNISEYIKEITDFYCNFVIYKWKQVRCDGKTGELETYNGKLVYWVDYEGVHFYKDTWEKELTNAWYGLLVNGKILSFTIWSKDISEDIEKIWYDFVSYKWLEFKYDSETAELKDVEFYKENIVKSYYGSDVIVLVYKDVWEELEFVWYGLRIGNKIVPFTLWGKVISSGISDINVENGTLTYKSFKGAMNKPEVSFDPNTWKISEYNWKLLHYPYNDINKDIRKVSFYEDVWEYCEYKWCWFDDKGKIKNIKLWWIDISEYVTDISFSYKYAEYKGENIGIDFKTGELLLHRNDNWELEEDCGDYIKVYKDVGKKIEFERSFLKWQNGKIIPFCVWDKDISKDIKYIKAEGVSYKWKDIVYDSSNGKLTILSYDCNDFLKWVGGGYYFESDDRLIEVEDKNIIKVLKKSESSWVVNDMKNKVKSIFQRSRKEVN